MSTTANCAVIIPARLDSSRLSRKLLRDDTGRALITYAVESAEKARIESEGKISEVIVATDSEEILNCVNSYAAQNGFKASAQMTDRNHNSGTDRIAEVAARLSENIDIIINLQGDEPDMPAREILEVMVLLENNKSAAMSTLYREIRDEEFFKNPNNVKVVVDNAGKCLYFSRSPIPYDREKVLKDGDLFGFLHFGIYGYRRETLLNYNKLPGSRLEKLEKLEQLRALEAGLVIVASKSDFSGTGIDTEEDYRLFCQSYCNK